MPPPAVEHPGRQPERQGTHIPGFASAAPTTGVPAVSARGLSYLDDYVYNVTSQINFGWVKIPDRVEISGMPTNSSNPPFQSRGRREQGRNTYY